MNSLWMAPWDAGGTFRIGSQPEVAIRRDRLRCVVQLSCRPALTAAGYLGYLGGLVRTCVIDLYAVVSTTPVEILVEDKKPDFPELASKDSRGRSYGYFPGESSKIALGFPRASCTPVEMCAVDSNFPRASFPPGELCVERQDYIRPSGCVCCGSLIQCDMYRHVARVLKEFGDPCRQRHAMPVCRAVTVSQIYLSDTMDSM